MHHELTKKTRNIILFNACLATFMATLDGSIVNIALPVFSKYFAVNINSVQWVVTAYLITISCILLIWGKLSDLYGRKYLFAAGIGIFTLGSLFCGLSVSFHMLVAARVIQAVGASITMALVQGIVTSIFPSNERGKAMGTIATVVSIGSLAGPSLGGLLVHAFGWRSIFFINVPVGIAGVILTLIVMIEPQIKAEKRAFDLLGALLFALTVLIVFISLLSKQDGIISTQIMILLIGLSCIIFTMFIFYERKQTHPFLEIEIFKDRNFSIGLLTSYISFLAMFAYIFLMPFYLQFVLDLDILTAGIIMSVYPIVTGILAPISGSLSDKITHRPLTMAGLTIIVVALTLLSDLTDQSQIGLVVFLVALLGIGNAIFQSPNTSSVMGAVTRDKLGVAGSVAAFFRNFGMVSGTTLSVLLFTFITKMGINDISGGTFNKMLFLKGYHVVLLSAAGICLIAVVLTWVRNRNHRQEEKRFKDSDNENLIL